MNLSRQIDLNFRHFRWACCVFLALVMVGCAAVEVPTRTPTSPSLSAIPPISAISQGESSETPSIQPGVQGTGTAEIRAQPPIPGLPSDIIDGLDSASSGGNSIRPGQVEAAPDRNLYQLAAQLNLKTDPDNIPRVVNPNPVSYRLGREDPFWLVNFRTLTVYQSQFELLLISPHAYWYVEKGQPVLQSDLQRAAREFEDSIYPRVSDAFGQEWVPGVDNDPHLNIIHAELEGVAGYFSSSDEHPQSVYPYSNQRETIYINAQSLHVGGASYLEVLAHELQHAVHWNNDNSEDTWVNEGLSDLAVSVAGYQAANINRFLRSPTVSLVHWPLDNSNIFAHYGGAALFFHYLAEHYSQQGILKELVKEQADGIAGIDQYLANQGYQVTFNDVFADWVVANVLDEPEGRYGYADLDVRASTTKTINGYDKVESEIPQYSVEYIELASLPGPVRLTFRGPTKTALLPTGVGNNGCWWSNSGDSISSTLTRTIDLRGQNRASLSYQVWYQIEKDWDYGYVQVSADQGRTWEILATPNTSPENPIGNSFGTGYTGDSRGWVDESIDISSYAGQEIQIRFQYVTDDAVNGAGLCFRNISVPEAGLTRTDTIWQSAGFVLINNLVKQDYVVQVIQIDQDNQVSTIQLDQNNAGEIVIDSPQTPDRLVVAVSALAPLTLQPAPFTLMVEPVK